VGSVDHPHPFKHHECIHGAGWGHNRPHIGADSTKLANERIPDESFWKEEASSKVAVAGAERAANANTILVVRDVAGRILNPGEGETLVRKKAAPAGRVAAGTTTARACRQPAEQPMGACEGRQAGPTCGRAG
jgi:hypothetical protein